MLGSLDCIQDNVYVFHLQVAVFSHSSGVSLSGSSVVSSLLTSTVLGSGMERAVGIQTAIQVVYV